MASFRGAASIDELRQRFLRDIDEADAADDAAHYARWGADRPRFLDTGEPTMRPTARHLLAPLWRDADDREYTPDTVAPDGTCDVWWVRIPPGLTRRQRAAGTIDMTQFPQPGDQLEWRRVRYGRRRADDDAPDTVDVRVAELIAPKTASAQIVLDAPAVAQRTDAERARLAERERRREQRLLRRERAEH
jgi:hypothetical protein